VLLFLQNDGTLAIWDGGVVIYLGDVSSQYHSSEHIMKPIVTSSVPSTILHAFRLRLLKLLLCFGIAALSLVWFFETSTARLVPIDRIAYPTMIVVFALACVLLFMRPAVLEHVEQVSFATFAIYIVVHAQPALLAEMDTYTLASLAQWFPLVYTAAFFFLGTRRAIIVSTLIYLSVCIPYAINLFFRDPTLWTSDHGLLMFNMVCSHPVYIVTLSGIATLKTHVTQARAHADVLHTAASVDYLTGVANRRTVSRLLQRMVDQIHEAPAVVSVILLDIDHFKSINDTYGHAIGDMVLVQVCTILQAHLRASDMLGRWGGEEFLIVANATDAAEAAQMAERLRAVVAQHTFEQVGHVAASFGVATSLLHDTPESLVKRADEALYLAKQGGRNRVEIASAL
jgi:diguanylate cyclase